MFQFLLTGTWCQNELQQQARTHAKLIDEKNSLEATAVTGEAEVRLGFDLAVLHVVGSPCSSLGFPLPSASQVPVSPRGGAGRS